MIKKIGNLSFSTYPVSKCNLNAVKSMTVYPVQEIGASCLICGKNLYQDYTFAAQISESECVKINGAACYLCNAFFTRSDALIEWLKIKHFHKGDPRIDAVYDAPFVTSQIKKAFDEDQGVFRLYVLVNGSERKAVFITLDRASENRDGGILYYMNSPARVLLKAERDHDPKVSFNGNDYIIAKTVRKTFGDERINEEIKFAIENQLLPFTSETTVYVYRGKIDCLRNHHLEEVRVLLSSESGHYQFYAVFCHECRKYLMKYADYENVLIRYKLFPAKVAMYGNNRWVNEFARAEQSPLRLNGYSVNAEIGLPKEERQRILRFIVDHGILTKRKVLDYLEMFISQSSSREMYQMAIHKWEEDKQFLLDYSEHPVPTVLAGKVESLRRFAI